MQPGGAGDDLKFPTITTLLLTAFTHEMTVDSDKLPSQDKPVDPSRNPLMKIMNNLQFEQSVRFYEADQALTHDDRKVMTSDMESILFQSFLVTSPAIALGVYLPTLIVRMRRKPVAYSGMLYRPFLSIFSGLFMAQITNNLAVLYMFKQKASTDDTDERRKAWGTMDFHSPALFYLYFKKTASDPSYILPDPRTVTKEELHKVHYKTPCGEKLHDQSKWDAIRAQNGFNDQKAEPSQLNSEAKSAWDKVRGSGSKGISDDKD